MINNYNSIIMIDFEFISSEGDVPKVVCLVVQELQSGQVQRYWRDELLLMKTPPYPNSADTLVVAYYASAEMNCYISLGWPLPPNLLDLYVEFSNLTNGKNIDWGRGLIGAMTSFGLSGMALAEKTAMRELILSGGPWTDEQKQQILDYCESDVTALAALLPAMQKHLDWPRALIRGNYIKSVALMESQGVPIDVATAANLRRHWGAITERLVQLVDSNYGIYEGKTFKTTLFVNWLNTQKIDWPVLPSGRIDLRDETFREMAMRHPDIAPLRELRHTLSAMRLSKLTIGTDGRNRCLLSPFKSRTGRNQPSTNKFIFGPAKWMRSLIKPEPGRGLAVIDWSQQEFGIAAALSGDQAMMEAYCSGDPYLAFAKQANAVPPDATKDSHPAERAQFKACALAVQYGMGKESLARRIGQSFGHAKRLLALHRYIYRQFWQWSDSVVNYALLYREVWTTFGWVIHVGREANERFLRNFPMQANGAEMLRMAIVKAHERGVKICAPIHDALVIEAPLETLDNDILTTQSAMADASALVLEGFELKSDVKIVRHPDRYLSASGQDMWNQVMGILHDIDGG